MSVVSLPIAEIVAIKHINGVYRQKNKQLLKNQLFSFELLKNRRISISQLNSRTGKTKVPKQII